MHYIYKKQKNKKDIMSHDFHDRNRLPSQIHHWKMWTFLLNPKEKFLVFH